MNTIWTRIGELFTQAADAVVAVFEQIRKKFEGDPETRRQVAFSVAMIALSAKMAKADGVVSDSEIKAFYEIFHVPENEQTHVARLFTLAKGDIAGFDLYAGRIARLCRDNDCDGDLLEDVLEGLFYIAKADGVIHENELLFLEKVSEIFGFEQKRFEEITARHAIGHEADPWLVLGLGRGAGLEEAKRRYHDLVREHHPDRLAARGLPQEFSAIANERLAKINAAWSAIRKELKPL